MRNNVMKTKTRFYLLAVSAAALSLNITTVSAQVFNSADVAKNSAIANSPRAREEFPWLTRETTKPFTTAKPSDSRSVLAEVTKNKALAASPRTLEQFPELLRPLQLSHQSEGSSIPASIAKNRAILSSPRTLEQYPELARGGVSGASKSSFEVAPVK
jgi:hypothetical protein